MRMHLQIHVDVFYEISSDFTPSISLPLYLLWNFLRELLLDFSVTTREFLRRSSLLTGYINKMEQRLSISEITPLTTEWTCKVQAVDKFRPQDNRDQRVHFQTIIVQDVSEEQVCVILYGDDIRRCDNLFELFETYLISTAKAPLPPPSRLSTISFADVAQQPSGVKVDLLAVVANCGAMQYTADQSKRFQEAIVMNKMKKPLFFTIWEDLASNEGAELLRQVRQLQEYPIILAKRIGTTKYQGVTRFATRYNSTILINPQYVEATELRNWINENKQMLIEYTMNSSAESASSLNLVAVDDEILSVSAIAMQTSTAESFYIEGEISLPEHFQRFYLLGCSECNHLVRSKIKREIQCINCRLPRMLIPRCHFEVEITDKTGTITAIMSEGLGERILSMTAEQIYDITAVKNELFPVAHINQLLADKLFRIQLQRSSSRTPDKDSGSLVLLSYTEKPTMFLPEESTSASGADRIMEKEPILVTDAKATKKRKREPSTLPKLQSRLSNQ
uniref:Replication protein A 70 kDa DNA-binding subunit D-like isoform X4 n=1 Tax=Nicotiana sylvestris TaxID=4096 RepID=A0A1U7W4V5_NICSY|nr:PREDICTED: replication protein A 70 kDa DNA-binding subunit D-like isoform X4 [Nicotiana sylvestris]